MCYIHYPAAALAGPSGGGSSRRRSSAAGALRRALRLPARALSLVSVLLLLLLLHGAAAAPVACSQPLYAGIAASGLATFTLRPNGRIFSFGSNAYGQLGIGATAVQQASALLPTPVVRPSTGSGQFLQVASSPAADHACALDTAGAMYCCKCDLIKRRLHRGCLSRCIPTHQHCLPNWFAVTM